MLNSEINSHIVKSKISILKLVERKLFIIMLIFPIFVFSQNNTITLDTNNVITDFSTNSYSSKNEVKNSWLAATEVVGLNILVWANSKYFTNRDWANISLSTIKKNIKYGFTWDGDSFIMNQFLHPFHGSLYFNSARSNGLTFWESAPYVLAGSLRWEYMMEIERPSYNDLLNTTISGIILGEITHRVSDLIIDESSYGFERFSREFIASLINPTKGLNRLIKGKMWNYRGNPKKNQVQIQISFGGNGLFAERKLTRNTTYLFTKFDMEYGNKFSTIKHKSPFDYFIISGELSSSSNDKIIGISGSGVLWDSKFDFFSNQNNFASVAKEFILYSNYIFKFTASSLSGELSSKFNFSSNSNVINSIGISGIFVGATNSTYAKFIGKDYNLGPGLGIKALSNLNFSQRLFLNFVYQQFWLHIMNGIDGDEFISMFKLGLSYKIFDNLSLGTDFILYERIGIYSEYKNVHISNISLRAYTKLYL